MKRILIGVGLSFGLLMMGTISVSADTMPMPAPGGGPAFGQHVSAMSPGQGGMTAGPAVGECVSSMASLGVCACPCPMP